MLNTIKFFLKISSDINNNEKNKIINISKTIQSNIDKDIYTLFQKKPFSKIDNEDTEYYSSFQNYNLNSESDSNNESDFDDGNESDPDIQIIKDIINENNLKQKKYGSNNNPTISFQYDISELINAIK
jgi:hypothetical protein